MEKFCECCNRNVNTKIVTKLESYKIFGDDIEVLARVLICSECGEELFCEELDNETLVNAYNIYRTKHKLLFQDDIISIRKQYGLSQRQFSKLLNWGDKTINRYENGAIPDKAHNSLLKFLSKKENMISYLNDNELKIDAKTKNKILDRIASMDEKQTSEHGILSIFDYNPSEFSGYAKFDYEKFTNMVLFFSSRINGLLKTKLMKLLSYSDMVFYKENGVSISGAKYAHLPYGPVPENYDILFGAMALDKIVHIEVSFENGYEKHKVIPDEKLNMDVFSKEEKDVMNKILNKFEGFGSIEISEYSHKEKGYKKTRNGQLISYDYASDIEI